MPNPISLFIVLILCVSGYKLLDSLHITRYSLQRSSGYHTFLRSAGVGIILLVIAILVHVVIDVIFSFIDISLSLGDFVLNTVFKFNTSLSNVVLFDLLVITILLSFIIPTGYYRTRDNRNKSFLRAFGNDCESPEFTTLFFKSMEYGIPILFTMSDRKVYIGYVAVVHAKAFNDIQVIPMYSGYRDKDDLKLKLVTPYKDILEELENIDEDDLEMFSVFLPIREIDHAHLHDFEYYEKFQEKEDELSIKQSKELASATIDDTCVDVNKT